LDKFEEILLQHRKDHFLVVDPPGGKGDQLIYMGMKKKLNELNINYKLLRYKTMHARFFKVKKMLSLLPVHKHVTEKLEHVARTTYNLVYKKANQIRDASADVVLLRGGAYLNDLWKEYEILENATQGNPDCTIIVAPQTFFFNSTRFPKFFEGSKQEIYLFCRERYSYNLLLSMNFPKNVHTYLSHDTALYLSKDDFNPQNGSYDLICPRTDKESIVDWGLEDFKKQRNAGLKHLVGSKNKVLIGDLDVVATFKEFLNLIEKSRKVYTDRLHVAILSAILGKDTFLYPNSYGKNKNVYEFSLCKFSNVRFVHFLKFLGLENSCS